MSLAKPAPTPGVRVIGAPPAPLRDTYHGFLRMPWWTALGLLVAFYLTLNACFACAYLAVDGVVGARPGSFADAFAFSIQTMGTIGYGAMYPASGAAHALVAAESVCGLIVTALATGLVFAKFSRTTARVVFTRHVTIAPMDGVPTLSFRVGNERDNAIMEATVRVSLVRTAHTKEGVTFYRLVDLALARERSPAVARSWTVMHPITKDSPLAGKTPDDLANEEMELIVTLAGVDDTSLQPIHARKAYVASEVVWGARHVDILTEQEDGSLVLDVRKFHDVVKTEATPEFPYPV